MSTKPRPVRGRTPWPSQGAADAGHEQLCPRQQTTYTCDRGHVFAVTFAADAAVPDAWECRCGKSAGRGNPEPEQTEHQRRMAQVLERRTIPELEQHLADRINELRGA